MGGMIEAETAASLREVLALAKRGWPVFPCSPNDKRPFTENGFQDASTDPKRIEAWSRKWPNAMWAVPTGMPIGAFVVDLDPKHGATAEQLIETLRIKCGGRLPPCPMVRTPRGGLH